MENSVGCPFGAWELERRKILRDLDIQSVKQRFGIIGNSILLNEAIQRAMQVAQTDLSVLINGESGTGKESFSKIIHSLSARRHAPFIAINCGAIPEGTIYSELFGHEKGSFTGSTEMRKGYFEVVDGGTIFLDEIGEMPLQSQSMLLRILENGEFIRMGSSKPLKTDVRVVAATNVELHKAIENKNFRQDLYYRLSTVPIEVPPLRERGEDIFLLFRKFTTDFAEQHRIKPVYLTDDAKIALTRYSFPGNIRQLKNIADQIALLEEEGAGIDANILKKYLPQAHKSQALMRFDDQGKDSFSERELLYKVLFEMRQDVNELKKLVLQLIQAGNFSNEFISQHKDLFQDINKQESLEKVYDGYSNNRKEALLLQRAASAEEKEIIEIKEQDPLFDPSEETLEKYNTHDIVYEEENDSLSLEDKEKELIIKALKKNNNRRRNAAQDLGISERTLYRKIKQYEIEK